MNKLFVKFAALILITTMLTGCASIMHGPMQNVSITSSPENANAHFKPKSPKGEEVTVKTPSTVSLHRKFAYEVTVEKQGYESQTRQLSKTMDGWLLGNVILGGIIGLIVDLITGSSSKLDPSNIHIDLKKLEAYLRESFQAKKKITA